jgi:hypothetical protein
LKSAIRRFARFFSPPPAGEVAAAFCVALIAGNAMYSYVQLMPEAGKTKGLAGAPLIGLHLLIAFAGAGGVAAAVKRGLPRPWWLAWAWWASAVLLIGSFGFLNLIAWNAIDSAHLPDAAWKVSAPPAARAVIAAACCIAGVGLALGGRMPSTMEGRAPQLPGWYLPAAAAAAAGIMAAGRYALGWDFFAACGLAMAAAGYLAAAVVRQPPPVETAQGAPAKQE